MAYLKRYFIYVVLLVLNLLSDVGAEVCTYYDDILDEITTFDCSSGCCDDSCCDGYWSDSSLAAIVITVIIGSTVFIAIVVGVCCRCTRSHRTAGRVVRHDRIPIISTENSSGICDQLAVPFTVFPTPVQPPSYEQAIFSSGGNDSQVEPKY
ncbi:uncharacterized protein LOC134706300 [Mytilus trossulus]|uniref:uncharacterized protein LOC134706300 n=1 Tax=Mytilus trossulus TaxID=6551 RepID=UPI003004D544